MKAVVKNVWNVFNEKKIKAIGIYMYITYVCMYVLMYDYIYVLFVCMYIYMEREREKERERERKREREKGRTDGKRRRG